MRLEIEDWGNGVPIKQAIERQDEYWAEKVFRQDTPDKIIFVGHEPVYTAGASCATRHELIKQCFKKEIWELPAPVEIVRRGGLVTYQGPGILSVYFIFSFKNFSPRGFNDCLLDSADALLKTYNVYATSRRFKKNPGLYIGEHKKIVSLGTQISKGVSRYGLAISVNPDEKYLEPLIPCGLKNMRMTSLAEELHVKSFFKSEKNDLKIKLAAEIISRRPN
ncbi:lipoyl(octanoyl) transferase [Candidatus Giovannonibacteria bacterium RIFCSPLOWO2_01_FULL_44_40]|uniref:Octanoyltransferase n=1 Tax=Candidatus Giovannonibacteria bacterium RIFCSPHIGHO2_01_FULL_45_23 TaxID=1798325 RepID=A0A1F5VJA4_9BACT|nr:MAG: lipoyl(octanoyl) transferase [Candidatus Giovannonibacteria bacterium RIFCSPHIGHO2_01_FULL_45_23]OGF75771.1 MAG: lipoyl(octanoyl) transferase [Candidatus Giovannonibacteria bacterium RIFCSPHIGHO2_02_FULL_45_13]OGF79545.1 MAG: lipoyl(octanoyl) transferase [Candidatus Giovannonibacteria bacterium RIFCSPLOWO2_01_FULL_44_40]